eukprot:1143328-Pelagomonas_calceolata.AAC.2
MGIMLLDFRIRTRRRRPPRRIAFDRAARAGTCLNSSARVRKTLSLTSAARARTTMRWGSWSGCEELVRPGTPAARLPDSVRSRELWIEFAQ